MRRAPAGRMGKFQVIVGFVLNLMTLGAAIFAILVRAMIHSMA